MYEIISISSRTPGYTHEEHGRVNLYLVLDIFLKICDACRGDFLSQAQVTQSCAWCELALETLDQHIDIDGR